MRYAGTATGLVMAWLGVGSVLVPPLGNSLASISPSAPFALTQEEVARRIGTRKSAISRIENHAENVTLSTLKAYANAVGRTVQLDLVVN